MGRPLRIKAPNLVYHITSRTNGRRLFMKKGRDRKALCRHLQQMKMKYGVKIYGFTVMTNHLHLLIHTGEQSDISQFMCEFKTAYAKYFNAKYNMSGHFWGDRFHSTVVEEDRHLLTCLRYIDRNPVKAGLVKDPGNWHSSSFNYYAHGKPDEVLSLDWHPVYLEMSNDAERRRALYVEFVVGEDPDSEALFGKMDSIQIFGSEEFMARFS